MKTGFFFWDNFIQVSKYPLNLPFLDLPVHELNFTNKNFKLTKNNDSYFLNTEDIKGKISVLKID